jgi:ribosome-associated translation inhibitor RaiA
MTIQMQIRELKDDAQLRQQVQADLDGLSQLIAVTSAHVALHCQWEIAPPCQATVMLAVSGPDIHAAARDYTWPAAWRKVVTRLREQIVERKNRQSARQKGESRVHTPTSLKTRSRTASD